MAERRTFAVVRPYPSRIRKRVFGFLESLGYHLGTGLELPAGTPNREAAAWANTARADLLLLPFHQHQDNNGEVVDGLQVAELLATDWDRPVLMPVSAFSWAAAFPRRFEELQGTRPSVAGLIVPMQEGQLGSAELRAQIRAVGGG